MTLPEVTHRVFYRVVAGFDEDVESRCEQLANLINECNGGVYGTSPMATTSNQAAKVMMSFRIPMTRVADFEAGEAKLKQLRLNNQ